ncbi:MAG: DUF542 domain-containing protein [Chloroflexi bacterium]|nr:DUF542 domain-containing protein [Chloroflexota bacterium]
MSAITKEMTINEVIRKYPQVTGVFNRFHLDSCCGGARTLEASATEDKLNLDELLAALNEAAAPRPVRARRG